MREKFSAARTSSEIQLDCPLAFYYVRFDSLWKWTEISPPAEWCLSTSRFIASTVYLPVYYYIGKRPRPRDITYITTWLYCQCDLFVPHFVIYLFIFLSSLYLPFRLYLTLWLEFSFAILPSLSRPKSNYVTIFVFLLLFPCPSKKEKKQKELRQPHRVPKCNLDRTLGPVGTGKLYSMSFVRVYPRPSWLRL